MVSRPNILFITSDQQRGDCYGFEGRNIRTPHLDQLARHGTRFPTCITPNPVCQPARASILTGLLPLTHGVHDNGIDLKPEVGARGFAGQLSAAGYHTALLGKAHFSTAHTFKPTGTPECRQQHAELRLRLVRAVHGFRPRGAGGRGAQSMAAAAAALGPALRALVLRRRLRRGEEPAACAPFAARDRRGADLALGAAGGVAQLDLGRRSHHRLSAPPPGASRSASGRPSPTRIIRSTAPSPGAGCTIRRRSSCRRTGCSTSTGGPGGTAPAWKACPRWRTRRCARSGRTTRGFRRRPMSSCVP